MSYIHCNIYNPSTACLVLQAAELEQQSDIASVGTMHTFASSAAVDIYKSASLSRQPTKAQHSLIQSTDAPSGPGLTTTQSMCISVHAGPLSYGISAAI